MKIVTQSIELFNMLAVHVVIEIVRGCTKSLVIC